MITKNFKNYMKTMLCSNGGSKVLNIPVTLPSGNVKYLSIYRGQSAFPGWVQLNISKSTSISQGIGIGSGGTAATENDINLESPITTFNGSVSNTVDVDQNGNPFITFLLTVTNTSDTKMTIREIGYAQDVYYANTSTATSYSSYSPILFDRTVLNNPVEIDPESSAVIKYTLKVSDIS